MFSRSLRWAAAVVAVVVAGAGCSKDDASSDAGGGGTTLGQSGAGAPAVGASGAAGTPTVVAGSSGVVGGAMPPPVGGDPTPPVATPDAGTALPVADAAVAMPDGGAVPAADAAMSPPATSGTCLAGSGDYTDDGPYDVESTTVSIGSKGEFTIYYPDPLEEDCPHPIVAWGNGTTITGGTAYDHFHRHAGSWGIVSIASHNSNVGDGSFHRAAIDYLLEQNEDPSSMFYGKLSTRAGVSGHSQGGAGSDRASSHPNVEANVNVQGSFGTPPDSEAALLCLTGTDDIQPTGCPSAVMAATVPALCASWDGADHVSTTLFEGEGIDQYKRLYTAWFRCFLADDTDACALFMGGESCPVCQEPGWAEIFANNY